MSTEIYEGEFKATQFGMGGVGNFGIQITDPNGTYVQVPKEEFLRMAQAVISFYLDIE